jgi:hypothetical protein
MTCKARLAYEDLHGVLHHTEEACCESNEKINQRKKTDRLILVYKKIWPEDLDECHSSYRPARGTRPLVRRFLEKISDEGYIVIKEEDVKNTT